MAINGGHHRFPAVVFWHDGSGGCELSGTGLAVAELLPRSANHYVPAADVVR